MSKTPLSAVEARLSIDTTPLTHVEFRALLKALGLRQIDAALLTGRSLDTIHRYCNDRLTIPKGMSMLMRYVAQDIDVHGVAS